MGARINIARGLIASVIIVSLGVLLPESLSASQTDSQYPIKNDVEAESPFDYSSMGSTEGKISDDLNLQLKSESLAWFWGAIPLNGAGLLYAGRKTSGTYLLIVSSLSLFTGIYAAVKGDASCTGYPNCHDVRGKIQAFSWSVYGFTYLLDLLVSPMEVREHNRRIEGGEEHLACGGKGWLISMRF